MLILLGDIYFGVWSLQAVSVDFRPQNLFDSAGWHLLWCLISTASECWFCATKSVWFYWATSALVSDLYSEWVLILCHLICLILLSDICLGVWSLQEVSVDFMPPNLFVFAEQHLLWCLISTASECWFFWVTSALVSDLYSKWVLILCHQIYLILLSDICFGVWFLQRVSVDFVPLNLFNFAEWHMLWCLTSTGSECWFCAT